MQYQLFLSSLSTSKSPLKHTAVAEQTQCRPVNPILSTYLPKHLLRPEQALIMAIHRQGFYRIFSQNERSWAHLKIFKGWCYLRKKIGRSQHQDRNTFIFFCPVNDIAGHNDEGVRSSLGENGLLRLN